MKVYCDSSVLVAASISSHPHQVPAAALFKQIQAGRLEALISAHGIAEFYAVLTRVPVSPAVHPTEAWQLLARNILPRFQLVSLTSAQYTSVLREAAEKAWTGGLIYDALHLAAATSSRCRRIYTFNLRHFLRIAPELQDIICSP